MVSQTKIQIFEQNGIRQIMIGVSPQFAMTKMDEIQHWEGEIYVEDETAEIFLKEILSQKRKDLATGVFISSFGAASVGYQLGHMVEGKKFPRAVGVFLDADCAEGVGCCLLPGDDAPERVVFESLAEMGWGDLWTRLRRDVGDVSDACDASLALINHHDWIGEAAKRLTIGNNILWHLLCAEWVEKCLSDRELLRVTRYIEDRLLEYP